MSITVGLSGCAPPAEMEREEVISCSPAYPQANVYKEKPQMWANAIFQYASTPIPPNQTPQNQQILEARYAAFQFLINETKRWSDTETIALDNSTEAQITVIFLTPELIQAVYLSELLRNGFFIPDFENQTQSLLNSLAERDELLFLVVVTATNYEFSALSFSTHVIDLPITEMTLVNAEDLTVPPKHDDHTLDQPIYISFGPVYGYLAYPLAIHVDTGCKWLLDTKYNTTIVLDVPSIQVNSVDRGPHTWSIQYMPLINPGLPPSLPSFVIPSGFDQNLLTPLSSPPMPPINLTATNNDSSSKFWQDMARFVWAQILPTHY